VGQVPDLPSVWRELQLAASASADVPSSFPREIRFLIMEHPL
jgi:hypothetical protein